MKATAGKHYGTWAVIIKHGHQTFYMEKESRSEARWYAKMFNTALGYYKAEIVKDTLSKVSDWMKGVIV